MATTFQQALAGGGTQALSALQQIKTMLTNPMIINTGNEPNQPGAFAIPLEVESHRQAMSATVSESLIIAADGKENMTDNIAPGSYTWTLSGYIPGIPSAELTNYFTPFVKLNTNLLKTAAKKGYTLMYKDMDNSIYKRVAIQSFDVSFQADCRNKTPFSMTLREINTLEDVMATVTSAVSSAMPVAGSIAGMSVDCGVTIANKLSATATNALISSLLAG